MQSVRLLAVFVASISTLVAVAPPHGAQTVWTVDDDGPADFADVQAAVLAASEGDTVLVAPGNYAAFEVVGKGLTISADGEGVTVSVWFDRVLLQAVPAGSRVTVRGIDVERTQFATSQPLVEVLDCDGVVWIEDARLTGGSPALRVDGGANVIVSRSVLAGFDLFFGFFNEGGVGADLLEAGNVALVDSTITGGHGINGLFPKIQSTAGGAAIRVADVDVVDVAGCVVSGGGGGSATGFAPGSCFPGRDGGDALEVLASSDARVNVRGSTLVAGPGGAAGGGCDGGDPGLPTNAPGGLVLTYASTTPALFADSPLREGESMQVDLVSNPTDLAFLFVSFSPRPFHVDHFPAVLVDPFGVLVYVGQVPPSGTISASTTVPPHFGPGFESRQVFFQAGVVPVATLEGAFGGASAVLQLDSTF